MKKVYYKERKTPVGVTRFFWQGTSFKIQPRQTSTMRTDVTMATIEQRF